MNDIEKLILLYENINILNIDTVRKELKDVIQSLEKQLNNGWNPTRERLPETYDDYLVTTKTGEIFISEFYGYGEEFEGFKEFPEGIWEIDMYEETVIAWRPLLEKYKEEINE